MLYKLPKEKKLLKSREFKTVLNKGAKFVLPEVVLFSKKNELPASRMGLIVTKKVGNAVVRNKIKRRLREVFRLSDVFREGEVPALDLVFIARPKAVTASYEKLARSYEFALKHVIKRHSRTKKPKVDDL